MISCAPGNDKSEMKENGIPAFQPEQLNDSWSKWMIGEWMVYGRTDWIKSNSETNNLSDTMGITKGKVRIKPVLNGQFLMIEGESMVPDMTDDQLQNLKNTTHASEEEIERFRSISFKGIQIYTIDPKTGEIIIYLFDSLRSMAEGRGRQEGNKQIIRFNWHGLGQGVSSIQTRQRIGDKKLIITEEFTMPDGEIMKEKSIMIRNHKQGCFPDDQMPR